MTESDKKKNSEDFPVHWLESYVKEIENRNHDEITLSTGKTPSGQIHMGILRELLICDALRKKFEEKHKQVKFRLFLDDLDGAKRFPAYIPKDHAKKYLGFPFALQPDPFGKSDLSYAEVMGNDLISSFEELGIKVEPVWTHNLYKTEEMKEMIRIGLRKNEEVKKIIAHYLTSSMNEEQKNLYLEQQKNWMGAMVICEKCQCTLKNQKDGTILANRVLTYNDSTDECTYKCPACGYEGTVKVSSGLLKLNWRLDWPAKWAIFHTSCEPAGKDHCTPGGSYDTGLHLCKDIYGYEGPVKVAYEWLRLGDRDMKTSKGIVFTPKHFLEMVDPEIIRMIIYQTTPTKHISIRIEELEQYYNEFERIERIYFGLDEPASEQEFEEIKYVYPLICINIPKTCPVRISFRLTTILAQLMPLLKEDGIYQKALEIIPNSEDKKRFDRSIFLKKINKALNWIEEMKEMIQNEKNPGNLKKLKQKIVLFSFIETVSDEIKSSLSDLQKQALQRFLDHSNTKEKLTEENIKNMMMSIQKEIGIKPMKIFHAF
ncbi:MAG: lysine--tRNA ligase, partial [Promethearchaeota archaeon]